MAMAWNGQLAAQALQPAHRSRSCSTANFSQRTTSRLKRCGPHTATQRPQPVQRPVSMSGSRSDLRGTCGSCGRRISPPGQVRLSLFMVWTEPVRLVSDRDESQTSPRPALQPVPCTQPSARPRPLGPPAWPRPIHRDGFAPSRTAPVSGPARPWPTGSPHPGPGRGSRAARRSYPWPYELHMNDSVAEWIRVERRGRCESLWRWTLPVVRAHTAANSSAGISVARRLSSRDANFDRWQDRVEAGCPSLAGPSASLPACVWLLDLGRVWRRRGRSRWTRPESGRTDRHASCSKPRAELRACPSIPTGCRHLTCGIERCLAAL